MNKAGKTPASGKRGGSTGTRLPVLMIFFLATGLMLLLGGAPAEARTFTVNSILDEAELPATLGDGICKTPSGVCTLRAAIQEANAYPGADTILLNNGIYKVTIPARTEDSGLAGDFDIFSDVTIKGKGAGKTFINGNKLDRVFHVIGSVTVVISDVTIQNGLVEDGGPSPSCFGGGIFNDGGTVSLTKVAVSNNRAASTSVDNSRGGGIYVANYGKLTVKNSVISNNLVQGNLYAYGGGIFNENGTVTLTGSTVSENSVWSPGGQAYGGGILNNAYGVLTMTQSKVLKNTASGKYVRGGGICSDSDTITITGGSITDNAALGGSSANGGGFYFRESTAAVAHCTIARNTAIGSDEGNGGGVFGGGSSYVATFAQCSISQNRAQGMGSTAGSGGGLYTVNGVVTLSGGTISDNSASGSPGWGGGIFDGATTLYIQDGIKIVRNFASGDSGGIFTTGPVPTISSDAVVSGNIPNDTNF